MPFSPDQIVVDSNVLISDYWLRKPSALLLEGFLGRSKSKLVVPRIVVEEVKNKHTQHVDEAADIFRGAAKKVIEADKKLSALFGLVSTISFQQPGPGKSWAGFLDNKLQALKATIIDYADVKQEAVVRRAIAKKKPFRSDDKGYRDTLLWEAVLSLCDPKTGVAFISNDTEAFWLDGRLHPDLQGELESKGLSSDRFRIFQSLAAFTDEFVLPFLKQERDYVTLIKSGKLEGFDTENEINANSDAVSEVLHNRPQLMRDDADFSEPTVTGVYDATNINISEALEASDEILVVSLTFSVEVNYSFFLDHADTISLEEDEHVVDWDWNEHTSRVETTRTFGVSALVAFNLQEGDVESFEVEDVKREW